MKKYQIIVMVALGAFSFAASFGLNWFRKQKAADAAVLPQEPPASETTAGPSAQRAAMAPEISARYGPQDIDEQMGLTERQLQHLIYDVREKMNEYNRRERELAEEAARLELVRQSLQEDIEQLNELRETLDMKLAAINEKEEQIRNTLIAVEEVERVNLERLGATYDKMDAVQAGKIMVNMAANNQLQDVVKILYYMNERNAARVLGQIGSTRPEVASVLSLQLKRVQEGE